MKTALQQLIDHLDPIHSGIKQKAIELLEVEKEQIMDAYIKSEFHIYAKENLIISESMIPKDAEQYYNETYK